MGTRIQRDRSPGGGDAVVDAGPGGVTHGSRLESMESAARRALPTTRIALPFSGTSSRRFYDGDPALSPDVSRSALASLRPMQRHLSASSIVVARKN
jgi:hypothetical protein